jgi:hypothetical protein
MSLDEDLRREQRRALAGDPSRRRIVELSRLASALAAAVPSSDELEAFSELLPESDREPSTFTAGLIAGIRLALAGHRVRVVRLGGRAVFRRDDEGSRPGLDHDLLLDLLAHESGRFYGTPRWLDALENLLGTRRIRFSIGASIAAEVDRQFIGRFSSRPFPPPRPTSSSDCAPEATRSALDRALAELPPPRRRRR